MIKQNVERYIQRGTSKMDFKRTEKNKKIVNKNIDSSQHNFPNKKYSNELYTECSKDLKILDKCEVLVVGGGPSGISAALSSSRAGAQTIIIEKFGCLGGVITTVGMETLSWYRYEGTQDCSGIGTEMENLAKKMGATRKWEYNDSNCLDAEMFKYIADKLILENNIKPILHCYVVDVIIEDNTIKGVITESKSGRCVIYAERVIDCTGDGDVCYLAGTDCFVNDEKNRMSVTSVFNCSNVDKEKFMEYTNKNSKTYADWGNEWGVYSSKESNLKTPYIYLKNGDLTINGTWSTISENGEATNLNLVHIKNIDCTNVFDLTKAEIEGRTKALQTIEYLREKIPGFENVKLRNFSMTLGTRDSRKIDCIYNMTADDVQNQARFEDSIGIFPEFIDGYNILTLPTTGRYFQVSSRNLITKKIDNLCVAGRCIGGDNVSHASMRNMMACCVTGQGAGVIAAISFKKNKKCRHTNIEDIQNELLRQGVSVFHPIKSKI